MVCKRAPIAKRLQKILCISAIPFTWQSGKVSRKDRFGKKDFLQRFLFVKSFSSQFPLVPSSNSCSPSGHREGMRKEEITLSRKNKTKILPKQKIIITTTEKQTTVNLLLTSQSNPELSSFHSLSLQQNAQRELSVLAVSFRLSFKFILNRFSALIVC